MGLPGTIHTYFQGFSAAFSGPAFVGLRCSERAQLRDELQRTQGKGLRVTMVIIAGSQTCLECSRPQQLMHSVIHLFYLLHQSIDQ